jgi:hypothetical protein
MKVRITEIHKDDQFHEYLEQLRHLIFEVDNEDLYSQCNGYYSGLFFCTVTGTEFCFLYVKFEII